jgi:hypothetical protein
MWDPRGFYALSLDVRECEIDYVASQWSEISAREITDALLAERRNKMVAVTYGVARVPAAAPAGKTARANAGVPRKSWFACVLSALIEARMQQARREIRMHTQLLPYSFDERGNRLVNTDVGDMPFGGW